MKEKGRESMQEQERMRKSPAEAEEGAQETEFERFLQESGLNEAQAMGLLRAAYGRQMQLMERAQQVLAAVRAIGDENFTIEALQSNPEAMRALEEGGTVGEIYRRYFLRRGENGEGEYQCEDDSESLLHFVFLLFRKYFGLVPY